MSSSLMSCWSMVCSVPFYVFHERYRDVFGHLIWQTNFESQVNARHSSGTGNYRTKEYSQAFCVVDLAAESQIEKDKHALPLRYAESFRGEAQGPELVPI